MILLSNRSVLGCALRSMAAAACLAVVLAAPAIAQSNRWQDVAQALGKSGTEMPGGVYRIGLPRSDLKVALDGAGHSAHLERPAEFNAALREVTGLSDSGFGDGAAEASTPRHDPAPPTEAFIIPSSD